MHLKSLPRSTSFEALFLPNRDYPYLEGAAEHPFRGTPDFAAVDAWWLAEIAMLSYVPDEDFVRGVLQRVGFSEVTILEHESTHCVIAGDIVCFRGTDDANDALKDLDAMLVPAQSPLQGRVHRGFQAALELLWKELAERIGGRPVWFVGHSLGGALAILAAARHAPTRAVYTLGAPRVGDAAFGAALGFPVYRVVNNNDLVTRLPPPVAYRHVGRLFYIDESGVLREELERWERVKEQLAGHGTRTLENLQRWLAGDFAAIPYDSLVDHAPVLYAIHLWNHYARERGAS